MNLLKALSVFMVFAAIFTACSKDDDKPYNLANTSWSDSANAGGVPYKPFAVTFKGDGSASVQFPDFAAFPGSWNKSLTSDSVFFFFDENATTTWKAVGVLTDGNTRIEQGVLTRTAPSAMTGTFQLTRQ